MDLEQVNLEGSLKHHTHTCNDLELIFFPWKQGPDHKKVNKKLAEEKYCPTIVIVWSLLAVLCVAQCGIPLICQDLELDKIFSRLLIVRSQLGCLDCQLTYSSTDGNCGHTKIPISGSCVPSLSLPLSCLIFGIFKACIDCCGHTESTVSSQPGALPSSSGPRPAQLSTVRWWGVKKLSLRF